MRSNIYDTGLVFKLQCTVCENNIIWTETKWHYVKNKTS
jgi:hypothetical protein